MKISRLKLLLLIIWGICGLFVFLSGEASLFSFGCVWFMLMWILFDEYKVAKRWEDDNS